MLARLPDKPDHDAIERDVLDLWERERTFERLRELNRDGPRFSFVDGPITANGSMGVHHAWGRTLKDVFQRYKAQQGFDQRYQNGFDCQGLWIEVGVERSLGLNSKREIEEFGLAEFARRCREYVIGYAEDLTRGSIRLGQWMDWGRDYFTFSDTNIEYVWRMLKGVDERGWLYMGHRSTEWCPRCGTSLSQHELSQSGVYQDRADPSLFVRLPLLERGRESLVVWTTTPWTLPANVAAAVKPDVEYGRSENGEWVAVGRYPDERFVERRLGEELVGWRYTGPFDELGPGGAVEHRVIPWDEVTLDQGTGIVHIAPGCGAEDFELSREHGLAVLTPVDEAGRFYDDYGWLHGVSTAEAADQIVGNLAERGLLVEAGLYEHAYPHCWRCDTPLIFRLSDDWFIAVDELRPRLLDANQEVEWTPAYMGKRMDDWLRNMGDWNISRRRYYGLPLPFYPCACGHLNVIGSKAELAERAVSGLEQLEELRRPWIDAVPIRCEACGEEVQRIKEVGDVWLDAGIVPFATLGWQNPEWIPQGSATGAARGLTTADLPDHAYWEQWFPADWISEMREQIRLWFYSQLLMSVALTGRAPFRKVLGYEKMLDERGREMHGSWGNMIEAEDAFARMGADVMRWQFCAQPPDRNLLFGYGPADAIKKELLRLWNSVRFLVDYGNIEGFTPGYEDLASPPLGDGARPLDHWLAARTQQYVVEATLALARGRRAGPRAPRRDRRGALRRRARPPGPRRRRDQAAPAAAGARRRGRRAGRRARGGDRGGAPRQVRRVRADRRRDRSGQAQPEAAGPEAGSRAPQAPRGAFRGPLRAAARRRRAGRRPRTGAGGGVRGAGGAGGLGPGRGRLGFGRARRPPRPRARGRGSRLRPRPRSEHDAQGAGPRADRPHRPHAARRGRSRPLRGLDPLGDARRRDRARPGARRPKSLGPRCASRKEKARRSGGKRGGPSHSAHRGLHGQGHTPRFASPSATTVPAPLLTSNRPNGPSFKPGAFPFVNGKTCRAAGGGCRRPPHHPGWSPR